MKVKCCICGKKFNPEKAENKFDEYFDGEYEYEDLDAHGIYDPICFKCAVNVIEDDVIHEDTDGDLPMSEWNYIDPEDY